MSLCLFFHAEEVLELLFLMIQMRQCLWFMHVHLCMHTSKWVIKFQHNYESMNYQLIMNHISIDNELSLQGDRVRPCYPSPKMTLDRWILCSASPSILSPFHDRLIDCLSYEVTKDPSGATSVGWKTMMFFVPYLHSPGFLLLETNRKDDPQARYSDVMVISGGTNQNSFQSSCKPSCRGRLEVQTPFTVAFTWYAKEPKFNIFKRFIGQCY